MAPGVAGAAARRSISPRSLFPPNMDRLELFALPASERLPILNELGIQTVINGAIPVSADGEPVMGLAPELDNFFVACGFTAGIAASGGAGEAMANWILAGDPGMDLWQFDVRRFGKPQAQAKWLEERAIEAYGAYYKIHWPNEEMHSARNQRLSPVHDRLAKAGAVFGAKFGWERPNWFAPEGTERRDRPSFEGKPNWFEAVAGEHRAIRERAAIIDQTSFAKFEVTGPGAAAFLQSVAANDVSAMGACVYTQVCNPKGGIEADLTLMRLAEDLYYGVTGSGFGVRDMGWLTAHMPRDGSVAIREVTNAWAVLNVVGPKARDVLQPLTDDDLSNAAFPYLSVREIELGLAPVRAARVGYVGELGWELHVPVEYAAALYDAIRESGRAHGIADAGYRAIESCRLEKGYLYWSADISPETNPYEAGLGFAVRLDKGDFLGRDALAKIKAEGPRRKLVSFSVEGFAPFHGGETILHGGKVVGSTTSAGFGHTLQRTIAFGYVPADLGEGRRLRDRRLRRTVCRQARCPLPLRSEERTAEGMSEADDDITAARRLVADLGLADASAPVVRLGGLTNRVYRVGEGEGAVCIRFPGKGTEEYIDRRVEAVAAKAAAAAGVSPEVLHADPATGILVTRFLPGAVTMTAPLFASRQGAPARAGRVFRQLHTSGAKFDFRFELFAMIDNYLALLATRTVAFPEGYADGLKDAEAVRAALLAHPVPLAPCHCDPLAENFLDTGDRMALVDWEYSGMNDPMWDLGDLSVEAAFGAAQEEEMLAAYFSGSPSPFDRGRMVIYKAMCDLLWTLWGLIQLANANPADDFAAYAATRFARCRALMAAPAFAGHLAAVAAGPAP